MQQKIRAKRRSLEVNSGAIKILRPLKEEEGFYFYTAVGKPTGENAGSLSNFYENLKSVKLESLAFHLQRKDFQNWVKNTLGDSQLAGRLSRIRPLSDEALRGKICATVENRIKELREASIHA